MHTDVEHWGFSCRSTIKGQSFTGMKLIKNDLYGLVDYTGLVDWAYVYMSKKPHCKERTRLFNLAGKKSIVRNNVRMLILGKKNSKRRRNLLIKRVINIQTKIC